jgi:KilA-N domain
MTKQNMIIKIDELEVRVFSKNQDDYISLTDMAKRSSNRPEQVIQNWLRSRNTIEFLALWEKLSNTDFNHLEFEVIKNQTGLNSFAISVSDWVQKTSAIGIFSKAGRYNSGTFAHKDIAFEFGSWISPSFKLLFIREFQRLKQLEVAEQKESLDWNLKRSLAKINYRIHTDAVKTYLIPPKVSQTSFEGLYYASEADILNVAMFGLTAKEWREANPTVKGNIRDEATTEQLLVLSNLENLNAEFLKLGMDKQERLRRLNETAIHQMGLFTGMNISKELGEGKQPK